MNPVISPPFTVTGSVDRVTPSTLMGVLLRILPSGQVPLNDGMLQRLPKDSFQPHNKYLKHNISITHKLDSRRRIDYPIVISDSTALISNYSTRRRHCVLTQGLVRNELSPLRWRNSKQCLYCIRVLGARGVSEAEQVRWNCVVACKQYLANKPLVPPEVEVLQYS